MRTVTRVSALPSLRHENRESKTPGFLADVARSRLFCSFDSRFSHSSVFSGRVVHNTLRLTCRLCFSASVLFFPLFNICRLTLVSNFPRLGIFCNYSKKKNRNTRLSLVFYEIIPNFLIMQLNHLNEASYLFRIVS